MFWRYLIHCTSILTQCSIRYATSSRQVLRKQCDYSRSWDDRQSHYMTIQTWRQWRWPSIHTWMNCNSAGCLGTNCCTVCVRVRACVLGHCGRKLNSIQTHFQSSLTPLCSIKSGLLQNKCCSCYCCSLESGFSSWAHYVDRPPLVGEVSANFCG
jgi:hypothetical protein